MRRLLAFAATILLALPLFSPGAGASHGDGRYDQPVWFNWDTKAIDVVVLPPGHGQVVNDNGLFGGLDARELTPHENAYMQATVASIDAWRKAVGKFGTTRLQRDLDIDVYVVGRDVVPPLDVLDPEIVVTSDESKGPILGVALQWRSGDRYCVVANSKFFTASFTYRDMYNISIHEFGHCLGLDHVGGNHPEHDVMDGSYDHVPGEKGTHAHCISNLNVKGLDQVFFDGSNATVSSYRC